MLTSSFNKWHLDDSQHQGDDDHEPSRVEGVQNQVMNKHGDKYSHAEYFPWAETVVRVKVNIL